MREAMTEDVSTPKNTALEGSVKIRTTLLTTLEVPNKDGSLAFVRTLTCTGGKFTLSLGQVFSARHPEELIGQTAENQRHYICNASNSLSPGLYGACIRAVERLKEAASA